MNNFKTTNSATLRGLKAETELREGHNFRAEETIATNKNYFKWTIKFG